MPRIRLAAEGWIFIVPVAILATAAFLIQWWIAGAVLALLFLSLLTFCRDPPRAGSELHIDVLSPADGTVVQIKDVPDGEVWQGLTKQGSIFMSRFDLPVNSEPIRGRV